MSVWRDKKGRYHVSVQRGGKRVHRICPESATWRDAKRREAEVISSFDSIQSGKVLIADAIQHWLNTEVAYQLARKTTTGNAFALTEWIKGKTLNESVAVANAYKNENRGRLTNSTINRRLAVLRRVANLAYRRWGWLSEHVAEKIELLPENPARESFLNRNELAKLLKAIPDRTIRRVVLVAAFTGLRRGEIVGLRPINVQEDIIMLKTSKNGRPRSVPVVHHVAFALKRLPFGAAPEALSLAVHKAMPNFRFHDLRHTAASFLVQAGVDIYRVGAILGHSNTQTTKRYAHLGVDTLRLAIATLGRKKRVA
jgi:integrase